MIEKKTKTYIDGQLRRIFHYTTQYKVCQDRAKISPYLFRCEGCEALIDKNGILGIEERNGEKVFADKLHVDHIEPFVPLSGWTSIEEWAVKAIKRMFVGPNKLQYLCGCCHYFKTQIENGIRRENKKK
jgi:hypothetical protein